MLTTFEAKRSRWVYEGGELERDSKSLRAVVVCLGITIMVLGVLWLKCFIVTTIIAAKVPPSTGVRCSDSTISLYP
jgi:hypothetical protein